MSVLLGTGPDAAALVEALGLDPKRTRSIQWTMRAGAAATLDVEYYVDKSDKRLLTQLQRYELVLRKADSETPDEIAAIASEAKEFAAPMSAHNNADYPTVADCVAKFERFISLGWTCPECKVVHHPDTKQCHCRQREGYAMPTTGERGIASYLKMNAARCASCDIPLRLDGMEVHLPWCGNQIDPTSICSTQREIP